MWLVHSSHRQAFFQRPWTFYLYIFFTLYTLLLEHAQGQPSISIYYIQCALFSFSCIRPPPMNLKNWTVYKVRDYLALTTWANHASCLLANEKQSFRAATVEIVAVGCCVVETDFDIMFVLTWCPLNYYYYYYFNTFVHFLNQPCVYK
jgi:hypothetical protein